MSSTALEPGRSWQILHGDVRRVAKTLPRNYFHASLSDPPYGLSFMGRRWDYSVPSAMVWSEIEHTLLPGAHGMFFGGPRTFHRVATAVEDGGFELRDLMMWLFGCLSDDAEILTEHGWKLGVDVEVGERVAMWDASDESIKLAAVEHKTIAPYKGKLVHFVNDDTDQLLTPNHRVYHQVREREQVDGVRSGSWSEWRVLEAGDINRWQAMRLPLGGSHDGEGIGGVDYAALLGWVWTEGGYDATGTGVRVYQSPSANAIKCEEIDALIARMEPDVRRYYRERTQSYKGNERESSESTWFFSGDLAQRVREDLPGKHPTWSLLWRMTLAEKRAFWDAAMKGDGSGNTFYQKNEADLEWAQALASMIGQRGKICMRKPPRDGGSVCITPRATTELQHKHLQAIPVDYDGRVWCVKVPSGAFVARRKGKIFITGNSGYPKSHDVTKTIDKRLGAKRKQVGTHAMSGRQLQAMSGGGEDDGENFWSGIKLGGPESPLAKQWDGFGTALKPGYEPIILARKMTEGTIAENVMRYGAGCIDIDSSRVGSSGGTSYTRTGPKAGLFGVGGKGEIADIDAGRWPANVILSHADECEPTGTTTTRRGSGWAKTGSKASANRSMGDQYDREAKQDAFVDDDGNEIIEVWNCAPDCPVRMINEQSGESRGGAARAPDAARASWSSLHGDKGGASRFYYVAKADRYQRDAGLEEMPLVKTMRYGKKGQGPTAQQTPSLPVDQHNTHPTVKPIDLIRYLAKMILPPPGDTPRRILVPFSGSGSEMIGCIQAGWDEVVGIEREAQYIEFAKKRIAGGGVFSGLMDKKMRRRKAATR